MRATATATANVLLVVIAGTAALGSEINSDQSMLGPIPMHSAVKIAAAVLAQRLVNVNLLSTGSEVEIRGARAVQHQVDRFVTLPSGPVVTIFLVVIPMASLLLICYWLAIPPDDSDYDDSEDTMRRGRASPSASSKSVPAASGLSPAAPKSALAPGSFASAAEPVTIPSWAEVKEQSAQRVPQQPKATAGSVPSLQSKAVLEESWNGVPWQIAARQSVPPLCPKHTPPTGQQTFKVGKSELQTLFQRKPVQIVGAFDYPVAYARLAYGPEGSRLELTSEPSWKDPEAIIGPLDYPAKLSPEAMVHGPKRELYGPFLRTGTGFAVGHYSRAGHVVMVTPKKMAEGLVMNVSSGNGNQIATVQLSSAMDLRISVTTEVDLFLVVSAVLASCVASQTVIDELFSSI